MAIPNNQDIPKDAMSLFFRPLESFIPQGKKYEDLTDEEKELVKNKYRFDPFRPGMYQGITGQRGDI